MPDTLGPDTRAVPRGPRRTIRARLTITYTLLALAGAGLLVAGIYAFMRYAPTYHFAPVSTRGAAAPTLTPVPGARPGPVKVVTAVPATFQVGSRTALLNTLLIGSLLTLAVLAALTCATGWMITRRMLRPLREITAAARLAADGRLDHRLALTGPRDELTDLADTFDAMLARLERAFQAHRRFALNASHELRTPLAATQAVLDVALAEPDEHTVTALASKLRGLNSRCVRIVDALLDLADAENAILVREAVALHDLVARSFSEIEAEASAKRIRLDAQVPDCGVLGEPTLLTQLVRNLVENAVRHNHCGGVVLVEASRNAEDRMVLRVQNTGPIVAPETLPLLTEPFYRGQGRTRRPAEQAEQAGHGLGLAIAEAIASAHGTQLVLAAGDAGGLTATIELPLHLIS